MYRFNISAPGTVFLNGQHAMRDKTCVAASLNLRTRLTFSSLPPSVHLVECIIINFINIDLYVRIPINIFLRHFYNDDLQSELTDIQLDELINNFITLLKPYNASKSFERREAQLSLKTFFYLLLKIRHAEKIKMTSSFIVELVSHLPIGQGLGSSASFAVCLAACFWRWSLLQKGIVRYEFTDDDLKNIKNYAFCCENIVYGAMSPVNTIVSTYGSVLMFKDNCPENLFLNIPSLNIVLVYSNITQSIIVQNTILQQKKLFPFVDSLLENMDVLSTTFVQVFNEIQEMSHNLNQTDDREVFQIPLDSYKQISEWRNIEAPRSTFSFLIPSRSKFICESLLLLNRELLKTLGISHPNLDIIYAIAKKFSFAGTLTGNSVSGYVFILLLPNSTNERIDEFLTELKSHNFPARIISLCCSGVGVE